MNKLSRPTYLSYEDYWHYYYAIKENIKKPEEAIPTKFAYIGWHGALTWWRLEKKIFSNIHNKESLNKLLDNFLDVFSHITNGNKIDIVSLGIGTGRTDIELLERINSNEKYIRPFNYYAVDISSELLEHGCERIYNDFKDATLLDSIQGFHLDIDSPHKDFISLITGENETAKLFHLLGLTIGNNNEKIFLGNILRMMNDGDYLLFDIDLSAETHNELIEAQKKYANPSNAEKTNKFLLNSLYFYSSFKNTDNEGLKLDLKDLDDNPIHKVKVDHIDFKKDKEKLDKPSVIDGSVSLKRKHIYYERVSEHEYKIINSSICDYSTKYKEKGVIEFLNTLSKKLGFEIITNSKDEMIFKVDDSRLSFVLLKKIDSKIVNQDEIDILEQKKAKIIEFIKGRITSRLDKGTINDFESLIDEINSLNNQSKIESIELSLNNNDSNEMIISKIEKIIKNEE